MAGETSAATLLISRYYRKNLQGQQRLGVLERSTISPEEKVIIKAC
jgi:hypothetical protein